MGYKPQKEWSRADLINMTQYAHQTDAVLVQVPVQNVWYTVLDTTMARLYRIIASVAVANETIEARLTIDGVVLTSNAQVMVAASWYEVDYTNVGAAFSLYWLIDGTQKSSYKAFSLEGKSVLLEIRKTTAAGANALTCVVGWARRL